MGGGVSRERRRLGRWGLKVRLMRREVWGMRTLASQARMYAVGGEKQSKQAPQRESSVRMSHAQANRKPRERGAAGRFLPLFLFNTASRDTKQGRDSPRRRRSAQDDALHINTTPIASACGLLTTVGHQAASARPPFTHSPRHRHPSTVCPPTRRLTARMELLLDANILQSLPSVFTTKTKMTSPSLPRSSG